MEGKFRSAIQIIHQPSPYVNKAIILLAMMYNVMYCYCMQVGILVWMSSKKIDVYNYAITQIFWSNSYYYIFIAIYHI